jgi:putative transposase
LERLTGYQAGMTTPCSPSYAGYRSPAEVISHAIWLYFRFPLSLRMVP